MSRWIFPLGLAILFTHELDAMTHSEWRVLPITSWMPESVAHVVFVLMHVPLFGLLMWFCFHDNPAIRRVWRLGTGAFLIVHLMLHLLFSGHPHYSFAGPLSLSLIWGAALCGAIYLVMQFYARRS